jgi:predicted nucleotidyltransferase
LAKPDRGVRKALADATALLEELGLRYAVVGGLAVGVWGVSRSTDDVDIFVELPVARRTALRRALVTKGFHVPAMTEELAEFGVFRSRSGEETFLDLFDAVGPLGEAVISRRRQVRLGRKRLWFVAPEDLVVLKAFSERERDFEDLAALLATKQDLDLNYVQKWAARLDQSLGTDDVSRRLKRATASVRRPRRPSLRSRP